MTYTLRQGSEADLAIWECIERFGQFEEARGNKFLDFNLPNYHSARAPYQDHREISDDLYALLENTDIQACPRSYNRVVGFLAYLSELESHGQQYSEIEPSMRGQAALFDVMGFQMDWIPDDLIAERYKELEAHCRPLGVDPKKYQLEFPEVEGRVKTIDDIRAFVEETQHEGDQHISRLLGYAPHYTKSLNVISNPESTYRARINGTGTHFDVTFVLMDENGYSKAELANTISHELCGHGSHFAIQATEIQKGNRPLHCGLTSYLDTDTLLAEAIADNIRLVIPPKDEFQETQTAFHKFARMVGNNLCYLALRGKPEEAEEYAVGWIGEHRRHIQHSKATQMTENPVRRMYLPIYGAVRQLGACAEEDLSREDVLSAFRTMYTQVLTPREINELFASKGLQRGLLNTQDPFDVLERAAAPSLTHF